jgi:hypothetical protein
MGQIKITEGGTYTFYSISDDGSRVVVDNQLVVDNDGLHGMDGWKEGTADLLPGYHRVTIDFFERGGQAGIKIKYAGNFEFYIYDIGCIFILKAQYAYLGLIHEK